MSGIPSMFSAILQMVEFLVLMVAIRYGIKYLLRKRKQKQAPTGERCKCGYPLDNLSVPRCPECGRVSGFDATPEELGLTDEQLQRAQAARRRRKEKEPAP